MKKTYVLLLSCLVIFQAGCFDSFSKSKSDNKNLMLLLMASTLQGPPSGAQWARTVSAGTNDSTFISVAVDSSGNTYAAGNIYGIGTYDFGNGKTAQGMSSGSNLVLVKYNSSGIAQWAKTIVAGTSDSSFSSVTVDSSGNIYAAGYIKGTGSYDFGNGKTAQGTSGGSNIVLVKYDYTGTAQKAITVTSGTSDSSYSSVAVDSSGNIYAAGAIFGTGTYNFGNGKTATGTIGANNIVLVKYNSSGDAQWANTTAGSNTSNFISVTTDSSGNIYAAGHIMGNGTYDFGNGKTTTGTFAAGANILLVKYSSSGVAQWANTVTAGSNTSIFNSITTDTSGNIYAAGIINGTGTYNFGNGKTVTGPSASINILLVKYNTSGIAQWANTVTGGSSNSFFSSLTLDSTGNIYAAGAITGTGTYEFGNSVTAKGTYGNGSGIDYNILLMKYNSSGVAQWAETISIGSNGSRFSSATMDATGNIYAAGSIQGTGTFDFGNSITATGTNSSGNQNNCLLVKYK